jgi:hypothetical protein
MSWKQARVRTRCQGKPGSEAGRETVRVHHQDREKSASLLPLLLLYQRAWERAHETEPSLGCLEQAAEAAALADAIRHLLVEAGEVQGEARWAVRLSEARHWCSVVRDAVTFREELES